MNKDITAGHDWKFVLSGDDLGLLKILCIRSSQQPGKTNSAIKFFSGLHEFLTAIRRNDNRVAISDAGQVARIKPIGSFAYIFSTLGNKLTQITVA